MTAQRTAQRGSALALVSLFGMVLIGFSALAIDAGRVVVTRTRLQRVADAAALAGAKDLDHSQAQARAAAMDFAGRNGVSLSAGEVSFPGADRVRVSIGRPVETVFARAFGILSYDVPAAATAALQQASTMAGLRPWGIPEQDFRDYTTNTLYKLKLSSFSGDYDGGGNFHALALGGNGGNVYRNAIEHGSQGRFEVGQKVATETGNMQGPTKQGIKGLIGNDKHSSYAEVLAAGETDCPRLVTLIVIAEDSFGKGRNDVTIAGFASFFITDWQDNKGEVLGEFVRYVSLNATGGGPPTGIGTQAVALVD